MVSSPCLIVDLKSGKTEHDHACEDDGVWRFEDSLVRIERDSTVHIERPLYSSSPLFVFSTASHVGLSSNWRTLVSQLWAYQLEPKVNLGFVRDYIQFQCPASSETFCEQVSLVRHGEIIRVQPDGSRSSQFAPAPDGENSKFGSEEFRDYLKADLPSPEDAVYHLSSGLDSSLLAILASLEFPGQQIKVSTCETRGRGASQELAVVRQLVDQFNFDLQLFDFRSVDVFQAGNDLVGGSIGYPLAHPSHLVRFLMDREISQNANVIVSGRGPDESLAGYIWHREEYSDPERHLSRLRCTADALLEDLLSQESLRSSESQTLKEHSRISQGGKLSLASRLNYDMRSIFESWNCIENALSSSLEVTYKLPFLGSGMVSRLMALPDAQKVVNDLQKVFLRESFADVYPEYVLSVPKMGLTIDMREYFLDYTSDQLIRLLCSDYRFGKEFANREGCERIVEDTLDGRRNLGWQIWSLYLCNVAYEHLVRRP